MYNQPSIPNANHNPSHHPLPHPNPIQFLHQSQPKTHPLKSADAAIVKQSNATLADLEIAQINLLHCKKATYTHCRGIKVEQTDISLIQETWIRGNKIHGFGQLHDHLLYYKKGRAPRAAIYAAPNVKAMLLNQFTNEDVVTMGVCRSEGEGGDFIVVSAYLRYDSIVPPPGPFLEKIVAHCEKEQIPLLIEQTQTRTTLSGAVPT